MSETQLPIDFTHRFAHANEAPVGAPYAKGSDTSKAAAERVAKSITQQRAEVLACIREAGSEGRTWDEIVAILDCSPTANGRVTELRDAGDVVDSGRRRPTRRGSSATVWIASEYQEQKAS